MQLKREQKENNFYFCSSPSSLKQSNYDPHFLYCFIADADSVIHEELEMVIWGVVTYVIHAL